MRWRRRIVRERMRILRRRIVRWRRRRIVKKKGGL